MTYILTKLIRLYQLTLSSLIGRRCRYLPTCSDYTIEAIQKHGAGRGLKLGLKRISRCHPWGGEGFDPVPDAHECPDCHKKNGSQERLPE